MEAIWNLTRICPWSCSICCMAAIHVTETSKLHLKHLEQRQRRELNFEEKLQVLKILCNHGFGIDFSGGDPLYTEEDLRIIEYATHLLPADKISVSTTGKDITGHKLHILQKIGVVEFTIDTCPGSKISTRPEGYNLSSYLALKKCIEKGINVRAVTVLSYESMGEENLTKLYRALCDIGVQEWELLRFYPVGRAKKMREIIPTENGLRQTMRFLLSFSGSTKIFFQHSLIQLNEEYSCPAGKEGIGIQPDGTVLACAWALDNNKPLEEFRLGKLPQDDLGEILNRACDRYGEKAKFCRVISFIQNYNSENSPNKALRENSSWNSERYIAKVS